MLRINGTRYGAVSNPRQMCLRPHGRPYGRVEAVISVKPAHAPTRVIRDMIYLSLGMVTEDTLRKCKDGPQEACTLMAGNYCSIGSLDKVFCQMHVCAYLLSGCLPENPKPAEDSEF